VSSKPSSGLKPDNTAHNTAGEDLTSIQARDGAEVSTLNKLAGVQNADGPWTALGVVRDWAKHKPVYQMEAFPPTQPETMGKG
jgi:hypothetical protein